MLDKVKWALVRKRDHFGEFVANYKAGVTAVECAHPLLTSSADDLGMVLHRSCAAKLSCTDICDLFSVISVWGAESLWFSCSMSQPQLFILELHCSWISVIV